MRRGSTWLALTVAGIRRRACHRLGRARGRFRAFVRSGGEFPDTGEVVLACDRALSQVGLGNEPARAKAMVDLHQASEGVDDVRRFVMDSVAGQGQGLSRIRAAYAVSEGSDAD